MIGKALENLELQLEDFIKAKQRLVLENKSLRKQVDNLILERNRLLIKNTQAVTKVKQIIIQLQDELACQI
jgi:uncharacterized protein (TIGR02449 family)